ncbi:FasG-like protein [Escherichia coli]|uniref:hypothetical protein n=1 Tax=Escherichia coli TaxID=562 RepID=UPI000DA58D2C|nr:hypothetical protein [Escherichia coli]SQQ12985.1 FasG-like protein [Escherichia coli]HCO8569970.1 hypothetical protein [Escherichia coli]
MKRRVFCSVFFIAILLGSKQCLAINSGAMNQSISGISLDKGGDYYNSPERWIKLGELSSISTYSTAESHTKCAILPLCAWSTVTINRGGVSWVKPYMSFYTQNLVLTGNDDGASYNFQFSLTFDGNPVIGLTSYNSNNHKKWDTSRMLDVFPSFYEQVKTWVGEEINLGGWCGNLYGCTWAETSYLHSSSPKPILWIKIPPNLKRQTYYFNNVKMMEIYHIERNNSGSESVSSQGAALFISGSITLPQRCYSSVDKSQLDFGDVFSSENNGLIATRSIILNSSCYYAPISSKHYIAIHDKSGGSLSSDRTQYNIISDSSGNSVLGFVFGINKQPVCSAGANDAEFKTDYLIRTISTLKMESFNDTINIGLCKYGIPSGYGMKNATIEVISRWEKG